MTIGLSTKEKKLLILDNAINNIDFALSFLNRLSETVLDDEFEPYKRITRQADELKESIRKLQVLVKKPRRQK
jgi:hypothetical protein